MLNVGDAKFFCEEYVIHLMENVSLNELRLMSYAEEMDFKDYQDLKKYKISNIERKESIDEALSRLYKQGVEKKDLIIKILKKEGFLEECKVYVKGRYSISVYPDELKIKEKGCILSYNVPTKDLVWEDLKKGFKNI